MKITYLRYFQVIVTVLCAGIIMGANMVHQGAPHLAVTSVTLLISFLVCVSIFRSNRG